MARVGECGAREAESLKMTKASAYPNDTPLSEYAKNPVLSARARHVIEEIVRDEGGYYRDLKTVGDLKRNSFGGLLRCPGVGPITCAEICQALGIRAQPNSDPELTSRHAASALTRLDLYEGIFMSRLNGDSAASIAKRLGFSRNSINNICRRVVRSMKHTLVIMSDTKLYNKRDWEKFEPGCGVLELPATKEVVVEWRERFLNYRKTLKAQAQKYQAAMQRVNDQRRPNGADAMEFANTLNDAELVQVVRAWSRREFVPYSERYQNWRTTKRKVSQND